MKNFKEFLKLTFPFIFGLLCFFLISIFISLPVSASFLTTYIPAPPSGVDNFVVGYMPESDTYRLGSTDYSGSFYITGDTLTDSSGSTILFGDRYELVNGQWVFYSSGQGWTGWFDSSDLVSSSEDKVIVFSSSNFYGTDGSLLASSSSDDILNNGLTVVSDVISSSSFLNVLYVLLDFFPFLLPVFIGIIAFRKSWGWLRGQIKGV